MKTITSFGLAMTIVSIGLVAVPGTRADARSPSESSPSKIVTGEVSQVEGEFHMAKTPQGDDVLNMVDTSYVITNRFGQEMRLELSNETKVQKKVNPGDKVEAKISSDGQTLSVTKLE